MKIITVLICIMLINSLIAKNNIVSFENQIKTLLEQDREYQQILNRYNQEKAFARIDRSLRYFDMNFSYESYNNDIERDETEEYLEESRITEDDERWKIELNRQFFAKDFDSASDYIDSRIDLLRYEQELVLSKIDRLDEVIEELINCYEAHEKLKILEQELSIYSKENEVLKELKKKNIIEIKELIDNLEKIDDLEDDIYDLSEEKREFEEKYDSVKIDHLTLFQNLITYNTEIDSIKFHNNVNSIINDLSEKFNRLNRKMKFYYPQVYLPEVNLSFSYNWRKTDQDWDIYKNGIHEKRLRNQIEEYPEVNLELSIPLDIFSNTSGKHYLLKTYKRELGFRSNELDNKWKVFRSKRLQTYRKEKENLARKVELKELYDLNWENIIKKYTEEPLLLGNDFEIKLQKAELMNKMNDIEYRIAEIKYHKEIFLINAFNQDMK